MSKHTKGPWYQKVIPASKELPTAQIEIRGSIKICTIPIYKDKELTREQIDNARLIAAAPRMYSWMKRMAPSWDEEARQIIAEVDKKL